MDPQKLAGLDPKLREAYQRVMGTPIPQPQATPQAQNPPPPAPNPTQEPISDPTPAPAPMPDPVPQPEPQPEPIQAPTPIIEEPPIAPAPAEPPAQPPVSEPQFPPAGGPTPEPAAPTQGTSNFTQMNSEVAAASSSPNFSAPAPIPQTQAMTIKKKNGMITPILFGIVSLIFIVIYTLFWTKIFNFQLTFLP